MAAFKDFIKKNVAQNVANPLDGAGIAFDIANLVTAENKLKAIGQLLKDLILFKPLLQIGLAGAFTAMSKSIRALLHDTGSLDAALRKLAQIQGMQRMFAPLVGGAEAAKKKVAELVNFAASKNLKLGDVGEAARSLEVMTRGAYSGAKALETIGDSAAASGNGLVGMADAVGTFYATLRGGGPIGGAAEQLREMGAISSATADELAQLQENGASNAQVFAALTSALEQAKGGMQSMAGEVDAVNAAFEAAGTNLQEKFASPFAEGDVQNTKNWTEAMKAVAPAVSRIAQFLQILTGGFSTAKSAAAAWAGQNAVVRGALEGLVYAITGLITVVSAVSALGLAGWLMGSAAAASALAAGFVTLTGATGMLATAITALGVAVRVAMIATGIGVILAVLGTAAGIIYNFVEATKRQKKAVDELRKAHDQAGDALKKNIDAVQTLADRHDQLAAAIEAVTKAQEELDAARAKGNPQAIAEAERNLKNAQANQKSAAGKSNLAATPQEEEWMRASADRNQALNEQAFRNAMETATPEQRIGLMQNSAGDLKSRADRANLGKQSAAQYSRLSADAENERQDAEGRLKNAQTGREQRSAQADVNAAIVKKGMLEESLPKDSSVYARLQAQRSTRDDRSRWLAYAGVREKEEGNSAGLSQAASEAEAQVTVVQRELDLVNQRAAVEEQIAGLKERGEEREQAAYALRKAQLEAELKLPQNQGAAAQSRLKAELSDLDRQRAEGGRSSLVARAGATRDIQMQNRQLSGDAGGLQKLADLDRFAANLKQMRGIFGDNDQAEKYARSKTEGEVMLGQQQSFIGANAAVAADSLARIGAGGNVASGGGDLVSLARRQADLQTEMAAYLKDIAGGGGTLTMK